MVELSGKVEIRVLDAETLEVLDVIEQNNVITKFLYYNWADADTQLLNTVYLSTDNYPHYEDWQDIRNCITNGYLPVGVTSPLLVPAAGAVPDYVQLMRRFDPPTSTRTINTVLLALTTGGAWTFSSQSALAYVNLTVPCVQTTTQLLDVFYRIQSVTPTYTPYNYYNIDPIGVLAALVSEDANAPNYTLPSTSSIVPIYSHITSSSNLTPTASQAMFANFSTSGCPTRAGATITTTVAAPYGQRTYAWNYGLNNGVGDIIAAWSISVSASPARSAYRPAHTTINVTAPNNSPIQPIFSHAASTLNITTTNPFLDSFPSLGSGTINFGGTWTGENFPELYKVDIVTGGEVGTATYRFSKRNHFGFIGSSYLNNGQALPGLYNISRSASVTIVKPHTCASSTTGAYGSRVERYDNTKIIMYDATGVTRYNCVTHILETWDNTSNPLLLATDVRQAAVNTSDGSIWVACANTGMYKISADGLTITNYTTANGLPSNSCYAVDIGRANAVWAICNGGVISSPDNGATWITYNAGTVPAFDSPILNTDWSSVHYMRVDPTHIDDRMLFIRKADTPLNVSSSGVWWSRGTGTAVTTTSISGGDTRREPCMLNVSDTDGMWIAITSATMYNLTYGTNTSNLFENGNTLGSVIFVRDSTDTQDLVVAMRQLTNFGTSSTLTTSNATSSMPSALYLYNNAMAVVAFTSVSISVTSSPRNAVINLTTRAVHLGNGVIAGAGYDNNGFGYTGIITSLNGATTPVGGYIEHILWEKYGWDGASWVLNHTGAKTTHSDDQVMLHGITTRFTNGAVGPSFIANDYYTGSVNDGILKNNAMTMAGSTTHYLYPTQNLSSFDGVVRLYPWTTGAVTWRKVAASLTVNVDNSLTNNIPYRSYGMSAGSKNRVFGDFSISGSFSLNTIQSYMIGISTEYITDMPRVRETSYPTWAFRATGNTIAIVNSAGTQVTAVAITSSATWNITRVGSTLTFYVNGISRYTITDSSYSFVIKAKFTDITTGTTPFTINPVVVNSSSSGYYTGLGNSIAGSGIYNNKQLVADIPATTDISIGGTPLTTLNATPATAPSVGTASLAKEEGFLFFNAADAGATITGNYFMSYQNTTPCNIIPV